MEPRFEPLMRKLRSLPPERLAEVEDFIDFLSEREARRGQFRMENAPSPEFLAECRQQSLLAARHDARGDVDGLLESAAEDIEGWT